MKVAGIAIVLSSSGVFLGQAAPELLTPWATGSAAAVLGLVLGWVFTKTIPSLQKENAEDREAFRQTLNTMANRHDDWEKARHEDSNRLHEALRVMSVTCARVHSIQAEETG